MSQTRRTFIASSAMAGAGLAMTAKTASASSVTLNQTGKKAELKLSSQEGPMPGKSLTEKLDFMESQGLAAVEPWGGKLWERVDNYKKALQGRNMKISAICAGFQGAPASENPNMRKQAMESMKRILEAAGELKSTGLIYVPAFNSQSQAGIVAGRYLLIDFLKEISEYAEQVKCRILLEPLNRKETWYVRQIADAAQICKEVDNPYCCLMGDFYHMGYEEADDYAGFLAGRKWLHHVHLASRPHRKQPGFDKNDSFRDGDDFRAGFRALKDIGFQDYCSFECGCSGPAKGQDADQKNKLSEMPKSIAYLKQQWEEA